MEDAAPGIEGNRTMNPELKSVVAWAVKSGVASFRPANPILSRQETQRVYRRASYRRRAAFWQSQGLRYDGKPFAKRWTGLSNKTLGHAEYMRQYRALKYAHD